MSTAPGWASAFVVVLCLCVPAAALWLEARFEWARRLGAIVLCYAAGLLAGNAGLLGAGSLAIRGHLAEVAVITALPMILLTMDVRSWSRAAPRALLAMALAVTSVVAVATAGFFALHAAGTPRAEELAGLAVGVYTGGTPNLAAIKVALDVEDSRYLVFNAVDAVVSVAYLMLMVTLGRPLFGRWLVAGPAADPDRTAVSAERNAEGDFRALLTRRGAVRAGWGLTVAGGLVLLALVLAAIAGSGRSPALVISLVATLGILVSLDRRVRGLRESYDAGMYLIYVFSFAVASMASLEHLASVGVAVPAFIAVAVFGSLTLHALLCRLARIDVDTFLVTSVSAICSPAFVPLIVRSLDNPSMLISGVTTGIIGYAVGTQLGIALALLLERFD
jgi:uncharacterized membrane protein